jgi:hypothetical protein
MTTANTRDVLYLELEETRRAYHALVAQTPAAVWGSVTSNPAWSVGELLYHIIIAVKFLPTDISMLRNGRFITPSKTLFDKINKWYTKWAARKHTPRTLLAEYDKAHTTVLCLLETIKDEEWHLSGRFPDINENLSGEHTVQDMFQYLTRHFKEHEAEIREALLRA